MGIGFENNRGAGFDVNVESVNAAVVAKRRRRRSLRRMLAVLGCMVVLVTGVALMAPAVSMTHGDLVCGLEEHAHTSKCYEKVLVCGMEEGEGAKPATEDEPAVEGHKHTDKCYEKQLVCDLPEHKHSDACYAEPDPEPEPEPAASGGEGAEADSGAAESSEVAAEPAGDGAAAAADGNAAAEPEASSAAAAVADDGAQKFAGELKDVTGKVTLSVRVDAPAGALPQGATMRLAQVKRKKVEGAVDAAIADAAGRVANGTAEHDSERLAAARADSKIESIQAVDIAFLDADGNEVEPAAPISVKLASDQIRQHVEGEGAKSAGSVAAEAGVAKEIAAKPLLVHVADDGRADMVDVLGKKELKARELPAAAADELVFDAGSFSVYAIVYTVDFHWEVDGKGDTWEITVTYGEDAGIPDGTELRVVEYSKGDAPFDECFSEREKWVANAANDGDANSQNNNATKDIDDLTFEPGFGDSLNYEIAGNPSDEEKAQVASQMQHEGTPVISGYSLFDISLVYNGDEIEPLAPVQVTIQSVDPEFKEYDEISVGHFVEDAASDSHERVMETIDEVSYSTDGASEDATVVVDFETSSFSLYDVTGFNGPQINRRPSTSL